jgi:hypothetical protein
MAIKKLQSVYGVVELNHVASVKTGEVFAQYELDATQFASKVAENGMLLAVDHVGEKIKLPADANALVGLVTSPEKDYEGKGRKYFATKLGEFLPRINKLKAGDLFETNAVEHDDAVYANYAAIVAAINATTVYGVPNVSGYIRVVAAPAGTEKVVLKAVKGVVLPNGENGIKWVVEKA